MVHHVRLQPDRRDVPLKGGHYVVVENALARSHHDFDALVLLVAERLIHVWRILEAHLLVGHDERRIDFSPARSARAASASYICTWGLSHLQREALGEGRRPAETLFPAIRRRPPEWKPCRPCDRQRSLAAMRGAGGCARYSDVFTRSLPGVERCAMGLEAYCIDARIRTLAAGQCAERIEDVDLFVVEHLGAPMRGPPCPAALDNGRWQSPAQRPTGKRS